MKKFELEILNNISSLPLDKKIVNALKDKFKNILSSSESEVYLSKLDYRINEIISSFSNLEEYKKLKDEYNDLDFIKESEMEISAIETHIQNIYNDILGWKFKINEEVIFIITQGVGGEESKIFAADLNRMYGAYFIKSSIKHDILCEDENMYKYKLVGEDISYIFANEIGTHRVQRVPETERSGRVHTSTAIVYLYKEEEAPDKSLNPKSYIVTISRSGGPGGQNVNKVATAVQLEHIETKIRVRIEGRSQIQNKKDAIKLLEERVYQHYQEESKERTQEQHKTVLSSRDRNTKIRTYNYKANRITDHILGITVTNLQNVLNGDIEIFLNLRDKK